MSIRLFHDPCGFCVMDDSVENLDQVLYSGTMPTAIVPIYTPEGFVVASDRYRDKDYLDAQKVFHLSPRTSYAISGWAGVSDEETGVGISFAGECNDVATALDMHGFTDLKSYGETF